MAANQDMIRAYLLRNIADKNNIINGLINSAVKSARLDFNTVFNEVLHFFAGGNNTEPLRLILQYNQDNNKKTPSYQFFDIDTLIAYDEYLGLLIDKIRDVKDRNKHIVASRQDFVDGFVACKRVVMSRKYKLESENFVSGNKEDRKKVEHYNPSRPITLMYKGGKLYPQRPMTQESFNKKYNVDVCEKEVELYLEEKVAGKTGTNHEDKLVKRGQVAEMVARKQQTKSAQYKDLGYMNYEYKGNNLKLHISKKEYFVDAQGRGVVRIDANNEYGRLFGCYYGDGSVYRGDLFDNDGNVVEIDGGGVVFYPSNKPLKDRALIEADEQVRWF